MPEKSSPSFVRPGQPSPRKQEIPIRGKPDDLAVIFPDGWVAVVRAASYTIEWYGSDGKLITTKKQPAVTEKTSRENKRVCLVWTNQHWEWPGPENPDETTGWAETMPLYVRHDPHRTIFPGPNGNLWITRVPTVDVSKTVYDIIDRNAKMIARLELPLNQRVVGFGKRSVYVAEVDEDNVQRLRRHPLPSR